MQQTVFFFPEPFTCWDFKTSQCFTPLKTAFMYSVCPLLSPNLWVPIIPQERCHFLYLKKKFHWRIEQASLDLPLRGFRSSVSSSRYIYTVSQSVVSDSFVTPWTGALQAPLSTGFPRQKHWSDLLFPSPGDLPDPGFKLVPLVSPALQANSLPHWAITKALGYIYKHRFTETR